MKDGFVSDARDGTGAAGKSAQIQHNAQQHRLAPVAGVQLLRGSWKVELVPQGSDETNFAVEGLSAFNQARHLRP